VTKTKLTWVEIQHAGYVGVMRQTLALQLGRQPAYGYDNRQPWEDHVNGAIAEQAVAKWAGVYWSGMIHERITLLSDVGAWEVRSKTTAGHKLIVRPDARREAAYISVLLDLPHVTICGWIHGGDAMRAQWLRTYDERPPAYFVPDGALRHEDELLSGKVEQRVAA